MPDRFLCWQWCWSGTCCEYSVLSDFFLPTEAAAGFRKWNIPEYVGTYKANYNNTTKEETIFGGTALNRENGNTIKLKIKVDKQNGDIEIINKLGTENEILISDTGEIEKTIDVKEKSYYLIIKTNNFTGNVDIVSE